VCEEHRSVQAAQSGAVQQEVGPVSADGHVHINWKSFFFSSFVQIITWWQNALSSENDDFLRWNLHFIGK
jgi:hypothetical protein